MNPRSAALFIAVSLLSARVDAQYDRELYHAEVCNAGELPFNVAVASTNFGFFDEFWDVYGWYPIHPDECKTVFSHWYAPQNLFSFQAFPVHLAFAFRDSTGVWGAVRVEAPDKDDVSRSRVQLCVGEVGFAYEVHAEDPQKKCTDVGYYLIPASIVWEPTSPATYPTEWNNEWGPPVTFTVALGTSDRAIPVGPQSSTPALVQGPGVLTEFVAIVEDAIKGPGAPKPRIASDYPITSFFLQVCAPPAFYKKWSWTDPGGPAAGTLKYVIHRFLASHQFRKAGSHAEEHPHGYGFEGMLERDIRITADAASTFHVEEVVECTGTGDAHVTIPVPLAEQPAVAPTPAAKPEPEPNPGFGDLIGPGGFIEPLPEK